MGEIKKEDHVVVLGISDKEERYAYKATVKLSEAGFHKLIGVSPKKVDLPQYPHVKCVDDLSTVKEEIHTLTVYVGSQRLDGMVDQILALKPQRIILNPGTENPELIAQAKKAGIEVVEGCTLVMLATKQF